MLRSTFSTTTIASSTTMRRKHESKQREIVEREPNIAMKKKVPMRETGMGGSRE